MTIDTNNILNNLQLNLAKISAQDKVDNKESSADRILHDNLNSEMLQSQQQILNFNDNVGFAQISDGVLESVSKQTDELNTLSVSRNNGILNNDQKSMIDSQMASISQNITKTLSDTTFNGKNLDIDLKNNIDISDTQSILDFQKQIDSKRADIGSFMNEANSSVDELSKKLVNEANSKANFEPDLAKNVNDFNQQNQQLNVTLVAQAHNADILANSIQSLLS